MSDKKIKNSSGVMWSAIERFAIQGSQFIISMIVARLLAPDDYGLIAMMAIFIAIATSLIDSGMAQALVQRQDRNERDLSTTLIFNIAISVGLYALIYICAPYIAKFYNAPQLCSIARVYSTIIIINSLSVVQQALITISLNFKRQAIASLTGIIVSGIIAIAMAYNGWGVWTIVAQQLINALIYNALLWALSSWRPHSSFSWDSFRVLSNYGSKLLVSGLMHTIYENMYTLIIGKYFTQNELGLYSRAFTISRLPSSNITTIVNRALFPILCEVQDSIEIATATFFRYLRILCFIVCPIMVGIAIAARSITIVLLGEKWLEMVPILQLIALANMWNPIMGLYGSIIRSQGRSADFLRAETIKKCCGILILIATVPFGIKAMCGGLIIYAFIDMIIVVAFARRISPTLGYSTLCRMVGPTIFISFLMGAILWGVLKHTSSLPSIVELTLAIFIGGGVMLGTAIATKRPEPLEIIKVIKEIIHKG